MFEHSRNTSTHNTNTHPHTYTHEERQIEYIFESSISKANNSFGKCFGKFIILSFSIFFMNYFSLENTQIQTHRIEKKKDGKEISVEKNTNVRNPQKNFN